MKKKLILIMLTLFVLPIFALFGCDDVSSYGITVFSSSDSLGSVSGYGTFKDGSNITLTASQKGNGQFVGWVYENAKLLADDQTYKIETNETKSTLTFVVSQNTQGSYTAVFDDKTQTENKRMMYIKLDSYRFVSQQAYETNENGLNTDDENLSNVITANMTISHGQSSSNLTEILSIADTDLKDNLNYHPEEMNQVLNLNAYTSQHLYIDLDGRIGSSIVSKDFRTNLAYQTSTTKNQTQNYASQVTYNPNGTYEIKFEFDFDDEKYYLILNYKNLTV